MKLARRLALALFLGILAVLTIHAWVRVQREIELFETDMRRDTAAISRALAAAVVDVWHTEGEARALDLVKEVNARDQDYVIRWVWLDAPEGSADASWLPPSMLEPARLGKRTAERVRHNGADFLVTCRPVTMGQRPGAIEVAESLKGQQEYIATTLRNQIFATLALVLVCGLMTLGLGTIFVGRPIRRLTERARRIGAGDLESRLDVAQRDEIGELAQEMNAMCDRLGVANQRIASEVSARIAAIEHLRHADRLATVGKLASGIAHELGTPLQVVSGRARMILDGDVTGDEIPDNARIIHEQSARMATIIRQLLDFARQRSPARARAELAPILKKTAEMLATIAGKRRVTIHVEEPQEPIEALVDASQLQQVLTNLIVNGVQASPRGGRIALDLARVTARPPEDHGGAEGRWIRVRVTDDGEGMPPDVLAHIFEPFFTTKEVGEGTGLGLAVAYGIVREHGGWIGVESRVGSGSVFSIYLPVSEGA